MVVIITFKKLLLLLLSLLFAARGMSNPSRSKKLNNSGAVNYHYFNDNYTAMHFKTKYQMSEIF